MALFGLFGKKDTGYKTPWLPLTVVYAVAQEGAVPEQAFALRACVMSAGAVSFDFSSARAFVAYFPGTDAGLAAGAALCEALRVVAREKSVPCFGVGIAQGECLAQMSASGRLETKPAGKVVVRAMHSAVAESGSGTGVETISA